MMMSVTWLVASTTTIMLSVMCPVYDVETIFVSGTHSTDHASNIMILICKTMTS